MKQSADHILTVLSQAVSPLHNIVEIGPGWGALARSCRDRGLDYTAIDANMRILHGLGRVKSICSFVPPIPLRDGVCDVVIASHVLEHSNGLTEAQQFIAEMARIVRTGGCITIVSPDVLWAGQYFWDCDYSHNFPTSSRRLYHMLLDQGLEVVNLEYFHNHLGGSVGYVVGVIVKLLPYRLLSAQPTSRAYSEKIYRLRMAFSRSVHITGRRRGKSLS
jgi:SAM-dependent methyltransferase